MNIDYFNGTDEQFDLMSDEFKRIKALTENEEILGICDRAVSDIEQNVPVIVQRNNAITKLIQVGIWLSRIPETPEILRIIREVNKATCRSD